MYQKTNEESYIWVEVIRAVLHLLVEYRGVVNKPSMIEVLYVFCLVVF